MKNIFALPALFFIIFLHSQTHRFVYELQYKMDSAEAGYEKLNMLLDINPKEVKFYGHNLLVTDSLNKKVRNQQQPYRHVRTDREKKDQHI